MSNTTETMTLTDFILQRIAEDEEAARAAIPEGAYPHFGETAAEECVEMAKSEGCAAEGYRHLRRWLPVRVLAECEAKRRIVEEHPIYRGPRLSAVDSTGTDFACERCHATSNIDAGSAIEALGACETLRALALPYADHPDYDYDESWRP